LTVNSEINKGSDFGFTFEVLDFKMNQDSKDLNEPIEFMDDNMISQAQKFKRN
jgi:hypothetical protein